MIIKNRLGNFLFDYRKSDPAGYPLNFYATNEVALEDMQKLKHYLKLLETQDSYQNGSVGRYAKTSRKRGLKNNPKN